MRRRVKVILPWPDRRVFPNAKRRKHWRTYQPAANADREAACLLASAGLPLASRRAVAASEGKIALIVTFYPPDARRRDDDGMVGAFKHQRDGIADALGVDDRRFRPHYFFEEPCKPGRVEVEISTGSTSGEFVNPSRTDSRAIAGLPQ